MKTQAQTAIVLLVEDNPGDVQLTLEAFQEQTKIRNIWVVRDGEEALAFLRRSTPHECAVRPDLILLDLNLPKKHGRDVLAEIKGDPNLRDIPVVILTTSMAEEDIVTCYRLHANSYVVKPVDLNAFFEAIRKLNDFWFTTVHLPPACHKKVEGNV